MINVRRMSLLTLLLFLRLSFAHAQTTRLETYPVEQLPFANAPRFVDGVRIGGELTAEFLLVDTGDFNRCYLLMQPGDDQRLWASLDGIEVPQGWTAQVDAADAAHCQLTLASPLETRCYFFRFVPRNGEGDWEMERYIIQRENERFEATIPGLWRMEAVQTQNGQVQQARVAYYWPNDCYNLQLDELPQTIEQMRQLERANPVAVIAPQNVHDRVNLRKGPGTNHPREGSLYSGVMVKIEDSAHGEWMYVNPLAGATRKGYVKRSLMAFGEEIWNVPNATQNWQLSSGGKDIPVDEHPFHSNDPLGYLPSDIPVNVIGYYNDEWAIVGSWPGALYVETKYLQPLEN